MDINLINIRQPNDSDINYVINTWLRSYKEHSTWRIIRDMPIKEYNVRYRNIILSILSLPSVTLSILTPSEDSTLIIGYAVYEMNTLHYIHVRKEFQRMGLAKHLISHLFDGRNMKFSHDTRPFQNRFNVPNWEFIPWAILGLSTQQGNLTKDNI